MPTNFSKPLVNTVVIAEAGINHNGNLEYAFKLADVAKKARADYIKFQLISPSTNWNISNYGDLSLRHLIAGNMLSFDDYCKVYDYCQKIDIGFLCSPGDVPSARLLNHLNLDALKISSSNSTNYHLLSEVSRYSTPLILSTGISSFSEIKSSASYIAQRSSLLPTILYCISEYPTSLESISCSKLNELYSLNIAANYGFSDHTLSHASSLIALSKGAKVFEKHFTLDRALKGPDHSISLSPEELEVFVALIRDGNQVLSEPLGGPQVCANQVSFGRSMYAIKDLNPGKVIAFDDIAAMRPKVADGVASIDFESLIGKTVCRPIAAFEHITHDSIVETIH